MQIGGYVRAPYHSAESRPSIRPGPAGASAGPIVGKASLPETAPNAHDRINGVEYLSRFGHHVDVAQEADEAGLTESRGKWILPVGDGIVTQIRIDFAFTLVLESWIEIRIETAFSYGPPGAGRQFEPSDPTALAPLLGVHQAVATAAQIRKDGRLTMTFADDAVLEVGPDERYEAFQVTGFPSAHPPRLPVYRSARRRPGSLLTISAPRALLRRCSKPLRRTQDASRC